MPDNAFTVAPTFQGISGIAHGGYVAGRFAGEDPLQVTLRRPPPLDAPLRPVDGRLLDAAGEVVMEAVAAPDFDVDIPVVSPEEARARPPHPRFADHPYARCFMCGTQRSDSFDLRVSAPGSDGISTAVWTPAGPLLGAGDDLAPEFVWAAVDCLSVWAFADRWEDPEWWPALTGRLQVRISTHLERGRTYVLAARLIGRDGRKITVDAAIRDSDGEVMAVARALWIRIPAHP